MKDSATGAIGAAAVAGALLLKYTLVLSLLRGSPAWAAAGTVFAMPVLSKWALVAASYHGVPARPDGLGRIFIGRIGTPVFAAASALTVLLAAPTAVLHLPDGLAAGAAVRLAITFGLTYLFCLTTGRWGKRTFGGLTGDTLGAVAEAAELIFLLVMTAWLQPST